MRSNLIGCTTGSSVARKAGMLLGANWEKSQQAHTYRGKGIQSRRRLLPDTATVPSLLASFYGDHIFASASTIGCVTGVDHWTITQILLGAAARLDRLVPHRAIRWVSRMYAPSRHIDSSIRDSRRLVWTATCATASSCEQYYGCARAVFR